jgi:hypothetical protein
MSRRRHLVTLLVCLVTFAFAAAVPLTASAGVSEAVRALAGPLAQQFGVSPSAVTGLLDGGLSLESVTQLLLVSQSSEKDLDEVKRVYDQSEGQVAKTASELKVAASEYSPEKVTAAIDEAKQKAQEDLSAKAAEASQDATEKAASATQDATDKAAGAVNDAAGSALKGLKY